MIKPGKLWELPPKAVGAINEENSALSVIHVDLGRNVPKEMHLSFTNKK